MNKEEFIKISHYVDQCYSVLDFYTQEDYVNKSPVILNLMSNSFKQYHILKNSMKLNFTIKSNISGGAMYKESFIIILDYIKDAYDLINFITFVAEISENHKKFTGADVVLNEHDIIFNMLDHEIYLLHMNEG